ncbi:MAG: hypothetical protein JO131_03555, partial [Gammaproteobacteria bacterium]|nr:hypothetical protein [Gammaproteobacteria bacterium]
NQSEKHFDTVNPTVTPENILKTKQITPVNFSIKQKPVREISCSDVTKGQISNRSLWLEKISEKQKPNIYPNNEFGKSDPSDLSEPPLPKCSSTSSVNR